MIMYYGADLSGGEFGTKATKTTRPVAPKNSNLKCHIKPLVLLKNLKLSQCHRLAHLLESLRALRFDSTYEFSLITFNTFDPLLDDRACLR